MQKITPCLWFDDNAEEAVKFYASLFKHSKIGATLRYDEASAQVSGRPAGSVMTVDFTLEGQGFMALNGGPVFKFTPAISLFVSCSTRQELDRLYKALSKGGSVLMPLDKYPFSERYAWISDKFGVSWQLILTDAKQNIAPCLLFVGKQHGKAEEAMKLYTSLFKDSRISMIARYETGEGDVVGTVKHAKFTLAGQDFTAMDSGFPHQFAFTEAISFIINCESQAEVDMFWEKLTSRGGQEVQCGWLKDKFGVSWQVVPTILSKLLADPNPAKAQRVMKAMLGMKKLDIRGLKKAAGKR
jgi:predicted 3-demethylubiquinone-9 3-methyltransferase (glyoxalase superfamily)